jgi:hypothetical protein
LDKNDEIKSLCFGPQNKELPLTLSTCGIILLFVCDAVSELFDLKMNDKIQVFRDKLNEINK